MYFNSRTLAMPRFFTLLSLSIKVTFQKLKMMLVGYFALNPIERKSIPILRTPDEYRLRDIQR